MKKIAIILLISINAYCLGYSQQFINLSKIWLMDRSNHSLSPEHQYDHLYYVKIGEDTIIDDIHYRKTIQTSDTSALDWQTFGYIRETADCKVYFRRYMHGKLKEEKILFDFNAKIGDTVQNIYTYYYFPGLPAEVIKIDSINLIHGKEKRLTLRYVSPYNTNRIEWIENVGDFGGGLIPNGIVPIGSDIYLMKCFFDHGKLLLKKPIILPRYEPELIDPWVYDTIEVNCTYPDLTCKDTISFTDTIWITDTITLFDTVRIYDTIKVTVLDSTSLSNDIMLFDDLHANIYPNPAQNIINVQLNKIVNSLSYSFLNNDGLILESGELNNNDVIKLLVSDYTPGIYYFRIKIGKHKKTFKILIR